MVGFEGAVGLYDGDWSSSVWKMGQLRIESEKSSNEGRPLLVY